VIQRAAPEIPIPAPTDLLALSVLPENESFKVEEFP
jgi:hypothetical protein